MTHVELIDNMIKTLLKDYADEKGITNIVDNDLTDFQKGTIYGLKLLKATLINGNGEEWIYRG